MCDINVICTVRPGYRCDPEIRGRLLFWQGNGTGQVLSCTLYAGVLSLYRMTPSRAERNISLHQALEQAGLSFVWNPNGFTELWTYRQQGQSLVLAPMPTRKLRSQTNTEMSWSSWYVSLWLRAMWSLSPPQGYALTSEGQVGAISGKLQGNDKAYGIFLKG